MEKPFLPQSLDSPFVQDQSPRIRLCSFIYLCALPDTVRFNSRITFIEGPPFYQDLWFSPSSTIATLWIWNHYYSYCLDKETETLADGVTYPKLCSGKGGRQQGEKVGWMGFGARMPGFCPVVVFYCCKVNNHKPGGLTQHTLITSQGLGSLRMAYVDSALESLIRL